MTSPRAAAASAGASFNESTVRVSDVKLMGSKEYVNMSPLPTAKESSYSADTELELGLGLSLGGGNNMGKAKSSAFVGRILTAKDFPTMVSSAGHSTASLFSDRVNPSVGGFSGTKRAADSAPQEGGSPTGASQVVGWPPIRTHRMNSLINQAKSQRAEEDKDSGESTKSKDSPITKTNKSDVKGKIHLGFVKVNMDGVQIGRKVDLNAHSSYETLAHAIEEMFFKPTSTRAANQIGGDKEAAARPSKLLDGSSEFVLTYEDKEGDWMLVGDVPWRMFLCSVKRLRIMRTSEANGLAPKVQEKSKKERSKPI